MEYSGGMIDSSIPRRTALGMIGAGVGLFAPGSELAGAPGGPDFHGRIPADAFERLRKREGTTVEEAMLRLLPAAQRFSRPPISNYRVGVVARGASGDVYLGANLEIPGQSLGLAVHGEQAACSNAYMHGEKGIEAIALTAAPCGHCRQFLEELSPEGEINVLVKGEAPVRLRALLPAAFGPGDLGMKQGALPVRRVKITAPGSDDVTAAAIAAACISYAPYTKAHSGVALRLRDGTIHPGAYIENAAFNPSLAPLQVALIAVLMAGKELDQIAEAVLVELEGAAISQTAAMEATMSAVRPGVRVRRVPGRMEA